MGWGRVSSSAYTRTGVKAHNMERLLLFIRPDRTVTKFGKGEGRSCRGVCVCVRYLRIRALREVVETFFIYSRARIPNTRLSTPKYVM